MVHPLHQPRGGWLLTLGVPVTQRRRPHVTQPDCPFAAAVHEGVAVVGVELSRRDHLRELLHVGWLDVHDIGEGNGNPLQCSSLENPIDGEAW